MSINAITVEDLSKRYRIGVKEKLDGTLSGLITSWVKAPLANYKRLRGLSKFDENRDSDDIIWALRDISFDVKEGEVLGIIGKNGAGKSTLLKILSRITNPTTGSVKINGRVSSLLEVGTGFHPELTGRENIYLNGTIIGMSKKEIDKKFDEIVDFSGVEKFIDTPIKRYSTGMGVRLAFAVAAHIEPDILIVDEVLAVGDVDFQKKCLAKMRDVSRAGRTVLFVSHSMPTITRLCPRVILLDSGRIVDDGETTKVVHEYLNKSHSLIPIREYPTLANAPGGEIAKLRSVRVCTDKGIVDGLVDIRLPLKVEMEFELFHSGYILLPHFHFSTLDGLHIFTSVDVDPAWRMKPRPKGRYISTVLIPGNFFSEGTILVSAVLITLEPKKELFFEKDTLGFEIYDPMEKDSARGDWEGQLEGIVRPLFRWETRYIPHSIEERASVNHW